MCVQLGYLIDVYGIGSLADNQTHCLINEQKPSRINCHRSVRAIHTHTHTHNTHARTAVAYHRHDVVSHDTATVCVSPTLHRHGNAPCDVRQQQVDGCQTDIMSGDEYCMP